jgi:diguanylate cyclase (GGDEF)-like protein
MQTEPRAIADVLRAVAYDPITGLANRSLLLDHIRTSLVRRRPAGAPCVLFVISVDGLPAHTRAAGVEITDRMLQEFALELAELARDGDTIARYWDDRFAVLYDGDWGCDLALAAEQLEAAILPPVLLAGGRFVPAVGCTVIAVRAERTDTAETLLREADHLLFVERSRKGVLPWVRA